MFELKISGNTPQEFYSNAVNALALLARGGQAAFAPSPPVGPTVASTTDVPEAPPGPNPSPMEDVVTPRRRGRKPAETIDAKPLPEGGDRLDDIGAKAEKPLTADDMRDRVKAIVAAHQQRGNDMPKCIAYVQPLFAEFEIKAAAEVEEERRVEFMQKSQAYLDGTA